MTSLDIKTSAKLNMMAESGKLGHLSLSDYKIACFTLAEIIAKGSCRQLNQRVADFFMKEGYKVSQDANGIYIIERKKNAKIFSKG